MIGALFFILIRNAELITLIPIVGMLAYFVDLFRRNSQLTPDPILVLFIVSVLAAAWALATVLKIPSVRRNAFFVAFIDLCFAGALVGGVYELRGAAYVDCTQVNGGVGASSSPGQVTITLSPLDVNTNKQCAMQKASFAFGIIDILLFVLSAGIVALMKRNDGVVVKERYRSSSHGSRRGHTHHRRSSSSRRHYHV